MRKYILFGILLVLGVRTGWKYILSEDFQKYGDANKAPWTCKANNILGALCQVASHYQRAHDFYDRVITRCPDTPLADEALYEKACTLEDLHRNPDALAAYDLYRQTFPQGLKIRLAIASYDRLRFSR